MPSAGFGIADRRWPSRSSSPGGVAKAPSSLAAASGRLAQHQHAGGVAVEAVDQARAVQPLAPGAEQAVDVLQGLGAALHGQARGLVEDQHLLVLVQHQRAWR